MTHERKTDVFVLVLGVIMVMIAFMLGRTRFREPENQTYVTQETLNTLWKTLDEHKKQDAEVIKEWQADKDACTADNNRAYKTLIKANDLLNQDAGAFKLWRARVDELEQYKRLHP